MSAQNEFAETLWSPRTQTVSLLPTSQIIYEMKSYADLFVHSSKIQLYITLYISTVYVYLTISFTFFGVDQVYVFFFYSVCVDHPISCICCT